VSKIATVTNFEVEDLGVDYPSDFEGMDINTDFEHSMVFTGKTLSEAYDKAKSYMSLFYESDIIPKFNDSKFANEDYNIYDRGFDDEVNPEYADWDFETPKPLVHVGIRFNVA
jgi:hypothetical protein